jgi:hypothetical protein
MKMNTTQATRLAVLAMTLSFSVASAQPRPVKHHVTTSCLTEIRGGRKSCWGIVIKFDDAQFKKRVRPNQLKIFEAKHGANLIDLMTWRTSRDRKQLTIKFRPGTGDFGTGNQAEITLYRAVFASPPKDFPDYLVIVQRTDLN